ncbi:MAG: lysoplasmalogenase [Chitinophagaceae bacterium]
MKPTPWLWLFGLAVAADLAAIYFQWNEVRYISKPLIVLCLLIWFVQQAGASGVSFLFAGALLFSLAGDVFLLFEDKGAIFFMLGLGSFLVAHVFYIVAFMRLRKEGSRKGPQEASPFLSTRGPEYEKGEASRPPLRLFWIIATAIYGSTLIYILLPYLDELKIPVTAYAFVLCAMLLSVVHAFRNLYARPGIICLAGALLFVISDSTLAINKFYMGFPMAGIVIMFTYAFAQFMLVTGAARHIRYFQTDKNNARNAHDTN